MTERPRSVQTDQAPQAIGPYVQGIVSGDLVFCSGQIGLDAESGRLVKGGIVPQTERALANLQAVLGAAGCTTSDVLKTTVYVLSMEDFAAVNAAYAKVFDAHKPARATVAVAELPMGALVEIDAVARVP